MKRFQITETEYKAIKEAERRTRDKNVSRRLRVIMMRYEGNTAEEAAKATGMSRVNVSLICKRYEEQGLEELIRNKYTSHRRALTEDQENEILERFEKAAEAGQEVTVKEILLSEIGNMIRERSIDVDIADIRKDFYKEE